MSLKLSRALSGSYGWGDLDHVSQEGRHKENNTIGRELESYWVLPVSALKAKFILSKIRQLGIFRRPCQLVIRNRGGTDWTYTQMEQAEGFLDCESHHVNLFQWVPITFGTKSKIWIMGQYVCYPGYFSEFLSHFFEHPALGMLFSLSEHAKRILASGPSDLLLSWSGMFLTWTFAKFTFSLHWYLSSHITS